MSPNLEKNKALKRYTTVKTGGTAEFFASPESVPELRELLQWASSGDHPVTMLGGGSNVLIADSGIKGLVIDSRKLKRIHIRGTLLTARAGDALEKAASSAAEHGLSGLEVFSGLPGTVGGAVYGNAGCFGHEMSDFLAWVDYLDLWGNLHRLFRSQHKFSYRESPFKHNPW
ncbi:MAG: FAD-binding protein, partial [Spirochaetales bacterium]|nr:FAD-binding protein [Spirochaetales bacterium]